MRPSSIVSIVLAFIASLTAAVDTQRTTDIFVWPLSDSKPTKLATVSYTPTNVTLNHPDLPASTAGWDLSDDDIVRVGFYHKSGKWSGVATTASNLAPKRPMRLQLHVKEDGELYHLRLASAEPVSQGEGQNTINWLNVQVVKIRPGPVPTLDKPIVVSADGQVEGKEPEKTFLQKYWWAIGLFLLLQVVMGGKGE